MASKQYIREYLIREIPSHPSDIAAVAATHFGISTQAVNYHLRQLVAEGRVNAIGNTRARTYALADLSISDTHAINEELDEYLLWSNAAPSVRNLVPDNVFRICEHGFTEIVNNAKDHSEGRAVTTEVKIDDKWVEIYVVDNGVGIFRKISEALNLEHEREAILELAKGKLTTDPTRHSGEGIFFTSRAFDSFSIFSGHLFFAHLPDQSDWLIEEHDEIPGTLVKMVISRSSPRHLSDVFNKFTAGDSYAFNITHVPVALAKVGSDNLVSRSQAKRLVARFEAFRHVLLNFEDVDTIGQAFADELFRVFRLKHPEVEITTVNTSPQIQAMIARVSSSASTAI